MKILIVILILAIILWYAFGRKWQFIRACEKQRSQDSNPTARTKSCEQMYKDFTSSWNVNWMPIAHY